MKCPKCIDLGLVEHTQEPGIYYCGNCGGHWLEYTPMESYVVEQDEMTGNAFRAIWDLKSEIKSDLKCPRDQCQLNAFTYKMLSWIFACNVEESGLMLWSRRGLPIVMTWRRITQKAA
jgi:Zn-finger nucleic acid-binding protein